MITGEQIQQAVERLVAAANPSKVILFGSYACGDATDDSDLDLMAIEQEVQNAGDEMIRLHRRATPCCAPSRGIAMFCSYGTMPCPPIQLQQDCCKH